MCLSLEQQDWLERKGVVNPMEFELVSQNSTSVTIKHKVHEYEIKRKKDLRNWHF